MALSSGVNEGAGALLAAVGHRRPRGIMARDAEVALFRHVKDIQPKDRYQWSSRRYP